MMFLRPMVMRDGVATTNVANDRYDAMRVLQQKVQPDDNVMLNNVTSALLPPLATTLVPDRRRGPDRRPRPGWRAPP